MYFKYFEIGPEDLEKINSCFGSIWIRPKKRVNYISYKDGFGFYHIVFADERGEVLELSVRIDHSGNMYINDVQYHVIRETNLVPLLESISEPRIIEDLCVEGKGTKVDSEKEKNDLGGNCLTLLFGDWHCTLD